MRILVTGGTGFVGRATVRALVDAGHEVRVIVRHESVGRAEETFRALPVEVVGVDFGESTDIEFALYERDAVVHAAAGYSYERNTAAAATALNAIVTTTVLAAALEARVRVVDVSSLVIFKLGIDRVGPSTPISGPTDSAWRDPYLRSKVLAEEAARVIDAAGLDRVTVHPGLVIGPDDAGPGPSGSLLIRVLSGAAVPDTQVAFVDVRDVGAAIVASLTAPRGSHFLLTAGVDTYRDLARRVDGLTGRNQRRVFLPSAALRGIAGLNDRVGGRLGDIASAGSLDYVLGSATSVDTSATTAFGIAFRPLDETLSDAIRWWVDNKVIEPKLAGRLAGVATST